MGGGLGEKQKDGSAQNLEQTKGRPARWRAAFPMERSVIPETVSGSSGASKRLSAKRLSHGVSRIP